MRAAVQQLLLGIKRARWRANDPRSGQADAEFRARRDGVVARQRGICAYCGYASQQRVDVHHLDDNHHNNADDNLVCSCIACHAYQHVGEPSKAGVLNGEGMGQATLVSAIPELSAQDLNHLQRALGAALNDPSEREVALQISALLADRAFAVKEVWGTALPQNFAAAMGQLTDEEYLARTDAVSSLRLLFNHGMLEQMGHHLMSDYPSLPVANWEAVAHDVGRKSAHSL